MAREGSTRFDIPADMLALAMGFAERNIASEFAQKLLQAKEPKDVMALHADKYPECGADRPSQGTGQMRGENDWAGCPALKLPKLAPDCVRDPANML
jgi:hypothetical protein